MLIAPAVPAIFAADGSGRGPGAVLHALTGQMVNPNNPAVVREYLSIYATGLGATFRSGDVDIALTTPQVLTGNVAAPVSFAGLAPGFVGLNQINVQVPNGVPSGSAHSPDCDLRQIHQQHRDNLCQVNFSKTDQSVCRRQFLRRAIFRLDRTADLRLYSAQRRLERSRYP